MYTLPNRHDNHCPIKEIQIYEAHLQQKIWPGPVKKSGTAPLTLKK